MSKKPLSISALRSVVWRTLENADNGEFGVHIDSLRLFNRAFYDSPLTALLLYRLVHYTKHLGEDVPFDKRKENWEYQIPPPIWFYLYDCDKEQDNVSPPARRWNTIRDKYGLIDTKRSNYKSISTLSIYIKWDRLLALLQQSLVVLRANYHKLELCSLDQQYVKNWNPRIIKIIPFEYVLSGQLAQHMSNNFQKVGKALQLYRTTGYDTLLEDTVRSQGFTIDLLLEEAPLLDLTEKGWDFRRRTNEALAVYKLLLQVPYVRYSKPAYVQRLFNEGEVDLMVAQYAGVAFYTHPDISPRPKSFSDVIYKHLDYQFEVAAYMYEAGSTLSPLEQMIIDENLRLGWLESRARGRRSHFKFLFQELMTAPKYEDIDPVQSLGIYCRLFPDQSEVFRELAVSHKKLTCLKFLENLTHVKEYEILYPGLVDRLTHLAKKNANDQQYRGVPPKNGGSL